MLSTFKGRMAAVASVVTLALVAVAGISVAQVEGGGAQAGQAQQHEQIRVATYEAERAFQNFHKTAEFMEFMQELEGEAMAAQEAGNQQRMMEIQFEFEMARGELLQSFESRIGEVVPELAREMNLQVVALEMIYTAEGIEPEDITDAVIEAINEGADVANDDEDDDPGMDPMDPQE